MNRLSGFSWGKTRSGKTVTLGAYQQDLKDWTSDDHRDAYTLLSKREHALSKIHREHDYPFDIGELISLYHVSMQHHLDRATPLEDAQHIKLAVG